MNLFFSKEYPKTDQFLHSTEAENRPKVADTSLLSGPSPKTVTYVSKKDIRSMDHSAANIPTNSLVDTKQNTKPKFYYMCCDCQTLVFEIFSLV